MAHMDHYSEKIAAVEDALQLIESEAVKKHLFEGVDESDPKTAMYSYPFGIWFRGQSSASWKLVPNVLRKEVSTAGGGIGVPYDETSLFYHFQLRVPEHRSTHTSTFDWLCLMQHYGAPTRLLDWTESVLTALFFAVEDPRFDDEEDSALFCLNARKLNVLGSIADKCTIGIPTSLDVALRAQMALARTQEQWSDRIGTLESTEVWDHASLKSIIGSFPDGSFVGRFEERLRFPTAVLPSRLNGRLLLQTGAFTISGGKANREGLDPAALLKEPRHLDDVPTSGTVGSFLLKCIIPADCRRKIRETLRLLGIHHGSLFPELENQARFIKEHWRPR